MTSLWGSATHHQRVSDRLDKPSRLRCPYCWRAAKVRRRITHHGRANGVTLMSGCEFHVRQWVRDPATP